VRVKLRDSIPRIKTRNVWTTSPVTVERSSAARRDQRPSDDIVYIYRYGDTGCVVQSVSSQSHATFSPTISALLVRAVRRPQMRRYEYRSHASMMDDCPVRSFLSLRKMKNSIVRYNLTSVSGAICRNSSRPTCIATYLDSGIDKHQTIDSSMAMRLLASVPLLLRQCA